MRLHPDFDFSALSAPERIELALALWQSIDERTLAETFPLTPAQAAELDRRAAEMDADADSGLTWEAVVAEARQRATGRPPR